MELLRKNIRHLRKLNKYTIQEFATILGMSKSLISSFESGYTGLSVDNLIKISKLFKTSLDDLIFKDLTKI